MAGIITLDNIRAVMFDTSLYDIKKVRDLMTSPPATLRHNDSMNDVMKKFDTTEAWNLPVVQEGVYIGFISKSTIFSKYRSQLIDQSDVA